MNPHNITKKSFGQTPDGDPADIYTLTNRQGAKVAITNYGATVVSLLVPDRDGAMDDVVLGFETLADYAAMSPYMGCTVGRFANRIDGGRFSLEGKPYALAVNNGANHLHGGTKGFDKVLWQAQPIEGSDCAALELTRLSPDGEEGYPGNLAVKVIYTWTDDNELRIEYFATTDQTTIVNLTNHSYFNLSGARAGGSEPGKILGTQLQINAAAFTPVNENLIPTGEIQSVAGTPLDFTRPTVVGERIGADDVQLKRAGGYDHNYVLDHVDGTLTLAAMAYEPGSGRVLEVRTTEPGIQFYSGNFLDGSVVGKGGKVYQYRDGFCLEAQHYPDSPNQPTFPTVILRPEQEYHQTTIYRFSARN